MSEPFPTTDEVRTAWVEHMTLVPSDEPAMQEIFDGWLERVKAGHTESPGEPSDARRNAMATARNIVNQIGDLYHERIPSPDWVRVRQETNDEVDAFVTNLILGARRYSPSTTDEPWICATCGGTANEHSFETSTCIWEPIATSQSDAVVPINGRTVDAIARHLYETGPFEWENDRESLKSLLRQKVERALRAAARGAR